MLPALCVLCESTLAVPFVVLVHSLGIKPSDVPPCCFCALSSARLRGDMCRCCQGRTEV